ncbi:MAG: polysaccharide export protein, partial [Acidobacteriales bacterium]
MKARQRSRRRFPPAYPRRDLEGRVKTKGWRNIVAALVLFAWAAYSQQSDCGLPGSAGDAPCQAPAELRRQPGRTEGPARGLPVIRDLGVSPSEVEPEPRSGGTSQTLNGAGPARRVPEPTEFQRFVEQSTGQILPTFGAHLFQDVPSTFAPVDRIPVTPDYPVGPGDQLVIRGWGQIDLRVSPVVDRTGAIYIPQIGELNVAGLKFSQLQDYLKSSIGRVYRNFDLSVGMGQLRSIQVFVMGHARRPGAYTVSSLSTLVNALFASGGPDPGGSMREIRLRRADTTITAFDLYDLLLNGDKSKDKALLPGDVIYIPPVGPQVALIGSLNTPAIYELKTGATLEDALRV